MRLLILTDLNTFETGRLIAATLDLVERRPGVEVCGIVTTRPGEFRMSRGRAARRNARAGLIAALNPDTSLAGAMPRTIDLGRVAGRHGIPVVSPPGGDLNAPGFIGSLRERLGADVALSYYCTSVLRRPFLDAFAQVVNFHDGLLPAYRGLNATSFSLYSGEEWTGFTFHRMTEGLDTGPVLVEGAVPVEPARGLLDAIAGKTAAAVAALPRVLDQIEAGAPGVPQVGEGGYFSRAEGMAMTSLERPTEVTAGELRRRLRAFWSVDITIGGRTLPVTRLRPSRPGRPLAIRTADGLVLEPDRVLGLPLRFYRG